MKWSVWSLMVVAALGTVSPGFAEELAAAGEEQWGGAEVSAMADPEATWVEESPSDAYQQVAAADAGAAQLATPADYDFTSEFARPVTNLHFNHPFIWNEFRPIFIHHEFPDDSAVGGGNVRIYAAALTLKLTDRLLLVGAKDGYIDFNPGGLPDETGWADLSAGLKYNLITDPARKFILSAGVDYEWTQGSSDVFQGDGEGLWDLYLSYGQACGRTHFIGTAGFILPNDSSEDSRVFHYHAHIDYDLHPKFTPLVELNGFHYLSNADRNGGLGAPLNFDGFDYTSFGGSDVKGNDVITMGVGFRTPINACTTFGAAYEWALTEREDLFEERITCDISYRF